MNLSRGAQIPKGHIAVKTDVMGIEMIALPESLFEIADAYERFSETAEYMQGEFSNSVVEDLFNSDPFVRALSAGVDGDVTEAAMDVEDELWLSRSQNRES